MVSARGKPSDTGARRSVHVPSKGAFGVDDFRDRNGVAVSTTALAHPTPRCNFAEVPHAGVRQQRDKIVRPNLGSRSAPEMAAAAGAAGEEPFISRDGRAKTNILIDHLDECRRGSSIIVVGKKSSPMLPPRGLALDGFHLKKS